MKTFTHCGICLAACGMEVEIESGKIVAIRGDKQHELTRGFLCPKGAAAFEMINDPLRVLHPYERTGAEWRRITWNEAINKISTRIADIISRRGPRSVALYYGAGTPTSSMNYVMADSFLRSLGSDRMYNVLTLEFTNRYLVMEKMYGSQFRVTQPDLEHTDCLLIFGSNPMVSLDHPGIVHSLKELKRRGGELIVVDPRRTETARMADIHAQVIPGTDLFLLQGIYSHLLKNKLYDNEFVQNSCSGFDFFTSWRPMEPAAAEKVCGVPAGTIIRMTEEFARAESACAVCKLGINTSRHGTLTYWLVEALNAVTGNVDTPGGLIFNPGILDLDMLSKMAVGKKKRTSSIGGYPYLTGSYPASVLSAEIMNPEDPVRVLIVDSGDPSLVFPNSQNFREARNQLELSVSIDIYMNETARESDFFLPAACFLEKDDLYVTFPDHFPYPFAQWSHKIVEPPGEARAEWEIFLMLSRAFGRPLLNQWPMEVLFRGGEFIDRIATTNGKFSFNPKNYYRLLLGLMGKVRFSQLMKHPHGIQAGKMEFGSGLKRLATRSRRIEVAPPEFAADLKAVPLPQTPADGSFILISGERSHFTKNTNLRGVRSLLAKQSDNFVRIHPADAASLSVSDGETVEVATQTGKITLKAKYDEDIRAGVVSISHGWGRILYHPESKPEPEEQGANVNLLTDDSALDEFTGMPLYNAIRCCLRKID